MAPVLKQIVNSTFIGALVAEFLITWAYLYNNAHHYNILDKNDPSYGKAMLYGLPTGAIIGFTGQTIEAVFIRVRIPIHKDQHLFELKKYY